MRRPSLAKHLRLMVRPRAVTRATGCRCPAISFSSEAAARGGTRMARSRPPAKTRRRYRSPDRDRDCRKSRSSRGRCAAPHRLAIAAGPAAAGLRHHGNCRRARSPCADCSARSPCRAAQASRPCHKAAAARRGARSSIPFRNADRRPPATVPPANRARRRNRPPARRRIPSHRSNRTANSRHCHLNSPSILVLPWPPQPARPRLPPEAYRTLRRKPFRGRFRASRAPRAATPAPALYG